MQLNSKELEQYRGERRLQREQQSPYLLYPGPEYTARLSEQQRSRARAGRSYSAREEKTNSNHRRSTDDHSRSPSRSRSRSRSRSDSRESSHRRSSSHHLDDQEHHKSGTHRSHSRQVFNNTFFS